MLAMYTRFARRLAMAPDQNSGARAAHRDAVNLTWRKDDGTMHDHLKCTRTGS